MCCSELQCVAVSCSVLQRVAMPCTDISQKSRDRGIISGGFLRSTTPHIKKRLFGGIIYQNQPQEGLKELCGNMCDASPSPPIINSLVPCHLLQNTATRCNTLQHTATHCNTLQHTATHCNTLQHTALHCNTLQHTALHCNTLQHTPVVYYGP